MRSEGLRVETDLRNEKMNAKIRDFANQKTPYILVFGDKEEAAGAVSVRTRGKGDQGSMPLAEFVAKNRSRKVTERLDAVYAAEESRLDPRVRRAQRRAIAADSW